MYVVHEKDKYLNASRSKLSGSPDRVAGIFLDLNQKTQALGLAKYANYITIHMNSGEVWFNRTYFPNETREDELLGKDIKSYLCDVVG